MDGDLKDQDAQTHEPLTLRDVVRWLIIIIAVVMAGVVLDSELGLPEDTSFRIANAAFCLFVIYRLGVAYRGELWPRISLWLALLANIGIFFTPLVDRPISRGEGLIFALPDAVIVLTARVLSYRVTDVHQRANRQTMILALVVAVVFCVGLLGLEWIKAASS